ncbi:MAG: hypothetical protein IT366_21545 [Candidatus Hydrogenedentes bacterium]|nr:hypothetical protein [Candidatus Hydrogenedentota bacterium]
MKAATAPVRMFGNVIDSANARLAGFVGGLVGAAALGASARFVKTQMDALDALGKTSDQLGINTEKLKAYEIGARKSGLEQETLIAGLTRFGNLLSKSGLNIGIDEGLRLAADDIMGLTSETDRLRAATELFGRNAGRQFLSFLEDGSAGLDAMEADAKRLGAAFSRVDIAEIEAANDAFEDISIALENVAGVIGVKVAPFVTELSTRLAEATANGTALGDKVTSGMRMLAKGVQYVSNGWRVFQIAIKASSIAIDVFLERSLTGISKLIHGFNAINKWADSVFGTTTKMIPTDWLDDFIGNLRTGIKDADDAFKQWKEDNPWISDKDVDNYFDNVIAKSRAAAEASVADNALVGDSLEKLHKAEGDQKFAQVSRMGVVGYLQNVARGTQINGMRVTGPNGARVQSVRDPQLQMTNKLLGRIAENTEDNTAVAA